MINQPTHSGTNYSSAKITRTSGLPIAHSKSKLGIPTNSVALAIQGDSRESRANDAGHDATLKSSIWPLYIEAQTTKKANVPLISSFRLFLLNCFHHEARSLFDGGELEPTGSGDDTGSWTGSMPGCDLSVTMVSRGPRRK